jgi:lysophospholipase L1-like esterase
MDKKTILFLGYSITQGACASRNENRYVDLVGEKLGATVINYGLGGTRIARQEEIHESHTFNYDFNLRAEIMQSKADYVVIFGGVNDYLHGSAPLGNEQDETCYTFYGAVKNLLKKLITKYDKNKIIVVLPLNTSDGNTVKIKHGEKVTLSSYQNIIYTVAKKYGLNVLDLTDCDELNPLIEESNIKCFADGLHPNDAGHRALAQAICDFINKL